MTRKRTQKAAWRLKAKRCFAWSHLNGEKDERTRFVAVPEIPPVVLAETAVRVQIVKDTKKNKGK